MSVIYLLLLFSLLTYYFIQSVPSLFFILMFVEICESKHLLHFYVNINSNVICMCFCLWCRFELLLA